MPISGKESVGRNILAIFTMRFRTIIQRNEKSEVSVFFLGASGETAVMGIEPDACLLARFNPNWCNTLKKIGQGAREMRIRPGTAQDIEAVMEVVRRVVPLMRASGNLQWDETYPNPRVFERDVELDQLWVAEIDGAIAGVAAITTDQEPEYAKVGWDISEPAIVVHRLAVDPALRGKGIAAALMLQAEVAAKAKGIGVLRVDTNSQNEATQKLFPKLGYTFAGEIGLSFRPGLRFLCYEKRLMR